MLTVRREQLYFKALLWATAGMAAIRFTGVSRCAS
jgi:hypothetical protein